MPLAVSDEDYPCLGRRTKLPAPRREAGAGARPNSPASLRDRQLAPSNSGLPMTNDDVWFAQNPETNFRLRRPLAGEVEEITRASFRSAERELAELDGTFPSPPGCDWWTMVVDAGATTVRLLVSRERAAALKPTAQRSVYAVVIGDRVPVISAEVA